MNGKRTYDDDDGRVIADMSGIERPRSLVPQTKREEPGRPAQSQDRSWESSFTPEERRMTVLAAVKAALLIGIVFIAGIGAVILLMVLFW